MIPKILLVEDDATLGMLLMDYLESDHYSVTWKRDALSALQQLTKQVFDIGLLDISMPGMDGFSLARNIKELYPGLPFLFITARAMKQDKLKAYELGAEDYITKPFYPEELACKIQVILRRNNHTTNSIPHEVMIGDYSFYPKKQEIVYKTEATKLTEKENHILLLLCNHMDQVLKRDEAVQHIYGKSDYFLGRSFDVFISRLRKILKHDENISIENVFKVGFMMRVKEIKTEVIA